MNNKQLTNLVVPDSIEPIIGYKALTAKHILGKWQLHSPNQVFVWPAKKRAEALCGVQYDYGWETTQGTPNIPTEEESAISHYGHPMLRTQPIAPMPRVELPDGLSWSWEQIPHKISGNDCSCGIYFVNTPMQAASYCRDQSLIVKVAMWGRVVQGSVGARGQYAYPQTIEYALDLESAQIVEIAETYGLELPEEGVSRADQLDDPTAIFTSFNTFAVSALSSPTFTLSNAQISFQGPHYAPPTTDEDEQTPFEFVIGGQGLIALIWAALVFALSVTLASGWLLVAGLGFALLLALTAPLSIKR